MRVGWVGVNPSWVSVPLTSASHTQSWIVCTYSKVTSAVVSALAPPLCVSSFIRLSPGPGKGLSAINQAGEDIFTACINEILTRNNLQSDIVSVNSVTTIY